MIDILLKYFNIYFLKTITFILILLSILRLFSFIIIPLTISQKFLKFNIINFANYSYFEYIINKTDSNNESYGFFNQKKTYCTCYNKNNKLKNISIISICHEFNCSKIKIDETKIVSHNLTKWKKNTISFNSAKYYYFQGINPITKKCDFKHGFYSCGFFENIQSEFCVKNLDNCPLIYPPIKNNNFSIDSIMDKSSDIVLKLSVEE